MKKGTRMLLVGSGIAAAGMTVVSTASYALAQKLVEVALDREEPRVLARNRERVSGRMDHGEFFSHAAKAAERLESTVTRTVEIRSHDGLRLVGHWRGCPGAKRAVVAMHGWRSSWNWDFGMISDALTELGCSVLYAEQRGQNGSEGDHMTFGMLERLDCLAWAKWVVEQTGGRLPVYLAGVSMGATTVLMTGGLELPVQVRGIVADCGFTSPAKIFRHVIDNDLKIRYGLPDRLVDRVCRKRIHMGAGECSATEALKRCQVPVLFVHGTEDVLVPVTMSYENYSACASRKRIFVVPGAGHGESFHTDPEGYRQELELFFRQCEQEWGL